MARSRHSGRMFFERVGNIGVKCNQERDRCNSLVTDIYGYNEIIGERTGQKITVGVCDHPKRKNNKKTKQPGLVCANGAGRIAKLLKESKIRKKTRNTDCSTGVCTW